MSQRGGNILSYLPPEQRQRVVLLIQRLQQQTQAKNKFQSLYAQARNEINDLQLRCSQLKDQNAYLKQQLHSSFSMISQVRDNFKASSRKRKVNANRNDEDWQDDEEEDNYGQNKQITSNVNPHPPKPILKSLEKYRPIVTSAEKSANLNVSSSFLMNSNSQSGIKSREVEELRREVRALQLQKQKQQQKAKQLSEKHRLVDEIKSRYKGHQDSTQKKKDDSIEKIDISQNFLQQDGNKSAKFKSSAKKTAIVQDKAPIIKIEKKQQTVKEEKPSILQVKPVQRTQALISEDYCDVLELINGYNL